jgi:predicted acylesterase/phospholipase RssA
VSTRSWALDIYCLVPYFILSCDGGGIRGLLPALLVQRLQRDLGLLDRTSLLAGTSAGGLISLALAAGIPVEKVVELFEKNGATIFTPFSGPAAPAAHKEWLLRKVVESFEGIWDKLRDDVESLFFVKYNNTGLKSLLGSMLPAGPLSGLKQVMVTTFQLDAPSGNWQPIVISNLPGASGGETQPIDAALCTSAAPTYFPPYDHPAYGYCVDGGVFANNPSAVAIAMALQAGVALSDICVLSLGTGTSPMAMKIVPRTAAMDAAVLDAANAGGAAAIGAHGRRAGRRHVPGRAIASRQLPAGQRSAAVADRAGRLSRRSANGGRGQQLHENAGLAGRRRLGTPAARLTRTPLQAAHKHGRRSRNSARRRRAEGTLALAWRGQFVKSPPEILRALWLRTQTARRHPARRSSRRWPSSIPSKKARTTMRRSHASLSLFCSLWVIKWAFSPFAQLAAGG